MQRLPRRVLLFAILALTSCHLESQTSKAGEPLSVKPGAPYVGNAACAGCHNEIYQSYTRSAMSHSSGPAAENLIAGDFAHKESGVNYRVYSETGKVWLSFDRPGDPMAHGKRELLYYIGQGRRGRTYLFSVDGFVFESPVNWYTGRHLWDMAPAHGHDREIPMNLPAVASCLDCHLSGMSPPVSGSENRYPFPFTAQAGVICERCHGSGAAHVNGGAIVNPAKLTAERRDQVCMQCHLEGDAAIERAGKHLYDFRPGDDLFDYVRYFTLSGIPSPQLRAASQFEALAQSVCKQKSGNVMSCVSCHDPHQTVAPENRVAFYRAKCLACHGEKFGARHNSKQPDCTSCHMPASSSSDVAHTQVTDHRIPLRPDLEVRQQELTGTIRLNEFPRSEESKNSLRDLALAWQSIVNSGMSTAQHQADQALHAALAQTPDDPALLSSLAYSDQKRGADEKARDLYTQALQRDSSLTDAATNLGVLQAKRGQVTEAVKLWQSAFERAPGKSEIGMNLARAFCSAAQYDVARDYTLRVLEFNPDLDGAKQLLRALNSNPARCAL